MIIPVRVPADAVTHIVTRGRMLGISHPLVDRECPVCDEVLGSGPLALIYVGTAPQDRDGAWRTGAAVAVHDECAGPAQEEGQR